MDFITFMTMVFAGVKQEELVTAALVGVPVYFATKKLLNSVIERLNAKIESTTLRFESHANEMKEEIKGVRNEMKSLTTKVGDHARALEMVEGSHGEKIAKLEVQVKEIALVINDKLLKAPEGEYQQ